jgi:uncharacterized protein (TIGR00730 family)
MTSTTDTLLHTDRPFSVCVYCGSRMGNSPAFADAAGAVGRLIGTHGWQLVYGGGNVGLMGVVADATLQAGGHAVGVIPRALMEREVGHQRLSEQHVVDNMHQRKQMMAERADAFLALPGGIGTLEELYEVWTWHQLGYHRKPIGLLNVEGYYDELLAFMKQTVAKEFLNPSQLDTVLVDTSPQALLERLHALATQAARAAGAATTDYSRI